MRVFGMVGIQIQAPSRATARMEDTSVTTRGLIQEKLVGRLFVFSTKKTAENYVITTIWGVWANKRFKHMN